MRRQVYVVADQVLVFHDDTSVDDAVLPDFRSRIFELKNTELVSRSFSVGNERMSVAEN